MVELTYKNLRDYAREEKAQPGLGKLQEDFYPSVQAFLSSKFSEMEESRSVLQMREFENAAATIRELVLIRQQKLLFRAIRSGGEETKMDGMTREEYEVYDRFRGIVSEENMKLNSLLSRFEASKKSRQPGQSEAMVDNVDAKKSSVKRVRFVCEVQEYIGMNRERMNPFKAGQESELPENEAEILLRQKMAEAIQ
jgi:DNA replication initiation complex subunit (GINS family)